MLPTVAVRSQRRLETYGSLAPHGRFGGIRIKKTTSPQDGGFEKSLEKARIAKSWASKEATGPETQSRPDPSRIRRRDGKRGLPASRRPDLRSPAIREVSKKSLPPYPPHIPTPSFVSARDGIRAHPRKRDTSHHPLRITGLWENVEPCRTAVRDRWRGPSRLCGRAQCFPITRKPQGMGHPSRLRGGRRP